MPFIRLLFCGVLFFLTAPLWAQLSVSTAPASLLPVEAPCYFVSQNNTLPDLRSILLENDTTEDLPPGLMELKYNPHLAFFCRVEVKIDQAVGTPFRFRLGSVDYVDYLEGKRSDY